MKLDSKKLLTKSVPFAKLIPNLVTLTGLIVGTSSIRFALDDRWEMAAICVFVAAIIDGLDGKVARMLNATSHFGAELDSLCDFVNFGFCPALLIYLWSFQQYEYKVVSWASIMFFVVCMAIRLARFNTSLGKDAETTHDKRFFTGVPAPVGALLAIMPMIIEFDISGLFDGFSIREHILYIDLYIVIVSLLLASRLPTVSLKKIHVKPEYLSLSMTISAVIIILAIIYPWYALPAAAIVYIFSIAACMRIVNNSRS